MPPVECLLPPHCPIPFLLSLFKGKSNLPVCSLFVQHTVPAVPASDGLTTLQRDILIAVAALVVDGARGGVDGGGGVVRAALLGLVARISLAGHFQIGEFEGVGQRECVG